MDPGERGHRETEYMILAILLGVILGTVGASFLTAVAVIVPFSISRAMVDVVLRRSLITGAESQYVSYVQNLQASGGAPERPWVGYLVQFCGFSIPAAIVVFLAAKLFAS